MNLNSPSSTLCGLTESIKESVGKPCLTFPPSSVQREGEGKNELKQRGETHISISSWSDRIRSEKVFQKR